MSSKDVLTYQRQQRSRRDRQEAREEVQDKVGRCSRALESPSTRDYAYVAERLSEDILPCLERLTSRELTNYGDVCGEKDNWNGSALESYLREENATRRKLQFAVNQPRARTRISLGETKRIVGGALRSVTCIAEHEGILLEDYNAKVDVMGATGQLGVWLQDEEMDLGDPVDLYHEYAGSLKMLICAATDGGKSTVMERVIDDLYQGNFSDWRTREGSVPFVRHPDAELKHVDLLGMRQGENWVYDLPQGDERLRKELAEKGEPEDFTEIEGYQTDLEILAPLTSGETAGELAEKRIPFLEDSDETPVVPFTIPASEIPKRLLIAILAVRVSNTEEQTLRHAYDEVNETQTDWALCDLADHVRERDDLSDKQRASIIGALRSLQQMGFIRTKSDPHTIDWEEIFTTPETRTVFTQALVDEKLPQVIVAAYLADRVVEERKSIYPDCLVTAREAWEIVPHKGRDDGDEQVGEIQEAIVSTASKLFRQERHHGLHVIADTQEPGDLHISVREQFNFYVVLSASKKTAEKIFDWSMANKWRQFISSIPVGTGVGGVVGKLKVAIENKGIEFAAPIEFLPPAHHHFDVKNDLDGPRARAMHTERLDDRPTEILKRPGDVDGIDWKFTAPKELTIEPYSESDDGDDSADPELNPMLAFYEQCMVRSHGSKLKKDDVRLAFNEFLADHGHARQSFSTRIDKVQFGKDLKSAAGHKFDSGTKDGETAYKGWQLTKKGREYLQEAQPPAVQSSAEPIRGTSDD